MDTRFGLYRSLARGQRARAKARLVTGILASALLLGFLTPSLAATFTVNSLGDFSDEDIGDGICETRFGNPIDGFRLECSLRGAIEEANATAGDDVIEFGVAGVIVLQTGLPAITEALEIRGDSAPGGPDLTSDLPLAPVVVIDAVNVNSGLAVLPLSNISGFTFIANLAIINAGVNALSITGDGHWISGCWLGVRPDGSAAGNERGMLLLNSSNLTIGRSVLGIGSGNVVSANLNDGISGNSNASQFIGNRIGTDAAGVAELPNQLFGVELFGDNNLIGGPFSGSLRNIFAFNTDSIRLTGDDNRIEGNVIGPGDRPTPSQTRDGITLSGDRNRVGEAGNALKANVIRGNGSGIFVGTRSIGTRIENNEFANHRINAISIAGATSGTVIAENELSADTIFLGRVDDAVIDANTLEGGLGIRITTANNVMVTANELTGTSGIVLRDPLDEGGMNNVIRGNTIRHSFGPAVTIEGGEGHRVIANVMSGNDGLGIDLGGDGPDTNDPGDNDTGPNRRQNSPVLSLVEFLPAPTSTVRLEATVDSSATFASYPLTVSLYLADPVRMDQGEAYLGDFFVGTEGEMVELDSPLPGDLTGGFLIATATDADGNTSEFSAPVMFGEFPELIFADGFE